MLLYFAVIEIYPEVLPEKCKNCPALAGAVEAWQGIAALQDLIITQSAEITDESLSQLPDDLIRIIGDTNNQSLDPAIDMDRKTALDLMREDNGKAYELLGTLSQQIEQDIQQKSYVCQDKGPLKLRVKTEVGSTLVSLCRADVKSAPTDHQHQTTAKLQREA